MMSWAVVGRVMGRVMESWVFMGFEMAQGELLVLRYLANDCTLPATAVTDFP